METKRFKFKHEHSTIWKNKYIIADSSNFDIVVAEVYSEEYANMIVDSLNECYKPVVDMSNTGKLDYEKLSKLVFDLTYSEINELFSENADREGRPLSSCEADYLDNNYPF